MKKGYVKLAVVLDRSGSMACVKKATIDGINEFIRQQQSAIFSNQDIKIVQFDHEYSQVYDGLLSSAPYFSDDTYQPRGMTALFDAIGRTVTELGAALEKLPEADRPEKVIVAIITDGYENNSSRYTQSKIAEMVKLQRETYSWDFVFIGANQDAVLTAATFNIPATSALSYNQSAAGVHNTIRALSNYVAGAYASCADPSAPPAKFTKQDRADAMK